MNQSIFMVLIYSFFFFSINNVYGYIGLNWGRMATQRLLPSMVVDLLLQNGIREVKIFSAGKNMLPALVGTDIGVIVTIPNDDLKNINNVQDAKSWINERLSEQLDQGLLLRYICIGTQPFSKMNYNKVYPQAVEVLDYVQTAIDQLNLRNGTVKATMEHHVDVMSEAKKPSEATLAEDVKDIMIRSTQTLVQNDAPIFLDMFPIYSAITIFNDTEFGFFDNNSTTKGLKDGEYTYNNIFEFVYDMFVCALEKEGFENIKIGVGQAGWPTDGIAGADAMNAERFNQGLIKYILSGKGTPRREGPIDTYLHNVADENQVKVINGGEQGGFIRHWGIYKFDGKPKYHLDFTGQGRAIYPYAATGVTRMPSRWCVFNRQTNDTIWLSSQLIFACKNADCTSILNGGTCGFLTFEDQVSYGFNMYFQEKAQKFSDSGCDFQGLGMITYENPSTGNCTFPVEILSNEYISSSITLIFAPTVTGLSMFLYIFLT